MDTIKVTILDDGRIKIETDRISGPNHLNAEGLVRDICTEAGGTIKRARRVGAKAHTHSHGGIEHTH